jgi:hypothetical protein
MPGLHYEKWQRGRPPPPLVEQLSRPLASEERMGLSEGCPVVNRKTVAAVTTKDTIFWNVMPCSLVIRQTSVTCLLGVSTLNQTTWREIPKYLICLKRTRLWSIITFYAHILVNIVPGLWYGDQSSLRAYKQTHWVAHFTPRVKLSGREADHYNVAPSFVYMVSLCHA